MVIRPSSLYCSPDTQCTKWLNFQQKIAQMIYPTVYKNRIDRCIYLKKTEKRDFWPSRTPRSFEIETSNFCYFQIRLTKYSKNFFIELACREHRFSHTRFSRFRPKSYKYMFIGLANVKLDFLILSVRSIFSCREDASPVLASLVGLVLPCGLASPLIEIEIYMDSDYLPPIFLLKWHMFTIKLWEKYNRYSLFRPQVL